MRYLLLWRCKWVYNWDRWTGQEWKGGHYCHIHQAGCSVIQLTWFRCETDTRGWAIWNDMDGTGNNLYNSRRDKHVRKLNTLSEQWKKECRPWWTNCFLRHTHTGLKCSKMWFLVELFPPQEDGILDKMISRVIVMGSWIDHKKHCRVEFGVYIQIHE